MSTRPARSNKPASWRQPSPGFRALLASFAFFGIVATVVYPHLPTRMVSHFDGSGRPDGYGSPAANLTLLVVACVVFVLVFGLLHLGIGQTDPENMNLPDTARWKDPAERIALRDNLADSMLWLAAASVAFMAIVFVSLCRASQAWSGGLGAEFWIGLMAYTAFMLIWPLLNSVRFSRPTPRDGRSSRARLTDPASVSSRFARQGPLQRLFTAAERWFP